MTSSSGVQVLGCGQWPCVARIELTGRFLPADFEQWLSRAWVSMGWRQLNSGSSLRVFSGCDPDPGVGSQLGLLDFAGGCRHLRELW
jgi:hypothetical protein